MYNFTFHFFCLHKTKPSSDEFFNVALNEDSPAMGPSPTTTTTQTFSTPTLTSGPFLDNGQVDHKPTPKKNTLPENNDDISFDEKPRNVSQGKNLKIT